MGSTSISILHLEENELKITEEQLAAAQEEADKAKQELSNQLDKTRPYIYGCLAVMTICAGFFMWFLLSMANDLNSGGNTNSRSSPPSESGQPHNHGTEMAFVMSQEFVKDRLVSPASAKFDYKPIKAYKLSDTDRIGYRVTAYVDSQNRFGATIRTEYECDMYYDPTDRGWSCVILRLDER